MRRRHHPLPTPVCIENTQTTVDPATCWARVYAHDLDHGSRDNCCNVLHFAVAPWTALLIHQLWTDYWDANCKADYWKYKTNWDRYLAVWLNVFVFKDYIDLTECGTNQVVLRVYEACGVPRYDPHIFPCSEHDWFIYNTYSLGRWWHNYQFFDKKALRAVLLLLDQFVTQGDISHTQILVRILTQNILELP
ncbi:MAG: hypothetical protein IPI18_05280 [Saprospiraceae bacterium]|nr:hypothetical protein [Saprospiraceae bacterium]